MSCKKECNPIWFVRREKMNLEFMNNESSPNGDEGGHPSLEKKEIQKGDGHPSCSSSTTTITSNNNDPISDDDEVEIIFQAARTVKPLEPETEEDDNLTMTKPELASCDASKLTDEKIKYEYCPNCFKKFLKLDRLMAHRKICHLQVNRPMHIVKSSTTTSSLPVVNSKNPPPQEASVQRYFCKLCSRSFKQKTDLGSHLQRHLDRKLPACHCNKAFTNHRHLLEHKRRHHNNDHHNKTTNSTKTINNNRSSSSRKMSGRKPSSTFRLGYKHYLCHRPNKSCKKSGQPKRRFLHTKFSCLVCAKKFKTEEKDEFSKHMKSHSRYRDTSIICKVCGMFFNGKQTLVNHLENHSQWMATLNKS